MRQGAKESKLLKSLILGRELSGEVVQVGKNVAFAKTGENVTAYVGSLASNGTYAEFISVPQELLAKKPEKLTFEEASALPLVGMTALQCFKRVPIPKNKSIFISGGAGGVGTILIKLLLANGNHQIVTTAGNDDSINHLVSLGLNKKNIVNYKNENMISALKAKNIDGPFEYIIDLVGGKMSELCAELIGVYGTYIDVPFLTTGKAREILFGKATIIVNVANYAHALKKEEKSLSYYGTELKELFDKIEHNDITPTSIHVVGNLSVETVRKAHQLMEENQTKGKKLVMKID